MGLLMGKIRPFLKELLPFFVLEKWFLARYSFTVHDIRMKLLACSFFYYTGYLNETSKIC